MVNRKRLKVACIRILPVLFFVCKQLIGRHVGRLLFLGIAVMFGRIYCYLNAIIYHQWVTDLFPAGKGAGAWR